MVGNGPESSGAPDVASSDVDRLREAIARLADVVQGLVDALPDEEARRHLGDGVSEATAMLGDRAASPARPAAPASAPEPAKRRPYRGETGGQSHV
jgi:hypothetical protein